MIKFDHIAITVDNLDKSKMYRTDINGNIVVTSDGQNLDIKTSK